MNTLRIQQNLVPDFPKIPSILLAVTVFLCGAMVMMFELVGSRVVGPYIGTSSFVWTSLIGIVLGGLSIGYLLGGKLADRHPNPAIFAMLIFASGLAVLFVFFFKESILALVVHTFSDIRITSVLLGILLFLPASILLGMVSPFAVKLRMDTLETAGVTIGGLYALSTLGSIFGTFLAGFFLIPLLGTNHILLVISGGLIFIGCLIGLFLFTSQTKMFLGGGTFVIIFVLAWFTKPGLPPGVIFDKDTEYSRVWIVEGREIVTKNSIRSLRMSKQNASSMYMDNNELVYPYTRFYHIARHFFPDFKRTLMLGGAGYSFPKNFLESYPAAKMDVIEIDPGITKIAQDYFRLESSHRLSIFHEDARVYLNRDHERYDVIYGDAFSSQYSIPYQLTTLETAQRKHALLSENGVVALNIISSIEGKKGQFLRAEYATYKAVFPQVYIFPVNSNNPEVVQNIMLVALKSNQIPKFQSTDILLNAMLAKKWQKEIPKDMRILTDDSAPVEAMIEETL